MTTGTTRTWGARNRADPGCLALNRPGQQVLRGVQPLQETIEVMIEHDLYHAGEINHIRDLHQGNDA